jgi:hypothetical protein
MALGRAMAAMHEIDPKTDVDSAMLMISQKQLSAL